MKKFVFGLVLGAAISGSTAAASDILLNISFVDAPGCQGYAGYAGMNVGGTTIFVCTSDGRLFTITSR